MATITQIQQQVTDLAVRIAAEIDAVRAEMGSISGATPEWDAILNKPSSFTPSAHTQTSATITDFAAAVDDRIALAGGGDAPDWTAILNKPATFPPSAHTHVTGDITGLQTYVDDRIALAGAGDGNVVGPAGGVVDNEIAVYNGTTGAAIKGSGIVPSANGISFIGAADYAAMKALLDLEIGTDVQAYSSKLAALAAQTWAADKLTYQTGAGAVGVTDLSSFGRSLIAASDADAVRGLVPIKEFMSVALSDDSTVITTGTNKARWRPPYAIKNVEVRAFLKTASSSGVVTIDVNEGGVSILSTKCTIDANELTSQTAATSPIVSDSVIAADAEVTFDLDTVGTGAVGAVAQLIFERA